MKLTTRARNRVKDSNFALPGRRYPIHDISHARNALARVSQFGTPEEKAQVRVAVHRRFPGIGMESDATATRGNLMEMITMKPLKVTHGSDTGQYLWNFITSSRENAVKERHNQAPLRFQHQVRFLRQERARATSAGQIIGQRHGMHRYRHTPPTPTTVSKKRIAAYIKKKMKANPSFYASVSESISGGRAEGMRGKFPKGQMRMGRKVEHEHSPRNAVADEIARDHLTEFPDYYSRLRRMEAQAKKYWSKRKHKMHEYQERIRGVRESGSLREVSQELLRRAMVSTGAKMEQKTRAINKLRTHPSFWRDGELGGQPIYKPENSTRSRVVKAIKSGEKKIIGAEKVTPGTYHPLSPQLDARHDVTGRSRWNRFRGKGDTSYHKTAEKIYGLAAERRKHEKQFWRFHSRRESPLKFAQTTSKKAPSAKGGNWKRRAAIGLGIAAAGYGAYKGYKYLTRKEKKAKESTEAAFANLVEVSDNLVYRTFKAAGERIASGQNQTLSPKQRQRKAMQAVRLGQKVTERMAKRAKELRDTWVRRGKYAAGGLALAGLGYGGYRYYKHRQAQKTQPTQESLREDGLDIRHLELGLKAAQAFGADKLLSRRVQQQKHRSSAWKYAKRGALAGYLVPAVVTGGFHALEMDRAAKAAQAEGVTGASNILKRAYELHQGKYKAPRRFSERRFYRCSIFRNGP